MPSPSPSPAAASASSAKAAPSPDVPPAGLPFRVSRSYDLLRQATAVAMPIYNATSALVDAVTFRAGTPIVSLVLVLLLLFLATHPWLLLPFLQVLLLRYMLFTSAYRRKFQGQPHLLDEEYQLMTMRIAEYDKSLVGRATNTGKKLLSSVKESASAALQSLNPLNALSFVTPIFSRSSAHKPEEDVIEETADVRHLDQVLRPHVLAALDVLGVDLHGMKYPLTVCQNATARVLEGVVRLAHLLNCNSTSDADRKACETLFGLLFASILWTSCITTWQTYGVAIVGSYCICRYTWIVDQVLSKPTEMFVQNYTN